MSLQVEKNIFHALPQNRKPGSRPTNDLGSTEKSLRTFKANTNTAEKNAYSMGAVYREPCTVHPIDLAVRLKLYRRAIKQYNSKTVKYKP